MKPIWKILDYTFNKKKEVICVRWMCLECPEVCVVELPVNKDIYHCMKKEKDDESV